MKKNHVLLDIVEYDATCRLVSACMELFIGHHFADDALNLVPREIKHMDKLI